MTDIRIPDGFDACLFEEATPTGPNSALGLLNMGEHGWSLGNWIRWKDDTPDKIVWVRPSVVPGLKCALTLLPPIGAGGADRHTDIKRECRRRVRATIRAAIKTRIKEL